MEKYFEIAYYEAKKAYRKNEIPVGAVIIYKNKIIAKAHNSRQKKHNVLGHAEINAIIKASKKIKDWRLDECTMIVTLEPCKMCEAIINECRIGNVLYIKSGKGNTKNNLVYKQTKVCDKLYKNYSNLINIFFENLRNNV